MMKLLLSGLVDHPWCWHPWELGAAWVKMCGAGPAPGPVLDAKPVLGMGSATSHHPSLG